MSGIKDIKVEIVAWVCECGIDLKVPTVIKFKKDPKIRCPKCAKILRRKNK